MESDDRTAAYSNTEFAPNWGDAIAAYLKELRIKQEWTQEELAHRSGYDARYINMLERGRRNPSIRALVDLCQVFEVRPSAFLAEIERRLEPTAPLPD